MNGEKRLWGAIENGEEMWDALPVFFHTSPTAMERLKLLFYPKKFVLYRYLMKTLQLPLLSKEGLGVVDRGYGLRILDAGCGTGGAVIDLAHLFGGRAEVTGVDVALRQIAVANERIRAHGVRAQALTYDGERFPFSDASFDAIYTSDVLGHVLDIPMWLGEVARVLKPGGALAMFAESALGRHAYIRRYLAERGLNIDPHARYHISLFSKIQLQSLLRASGFGLRSVYGIFWPAFFLHPEEYYPALHGQNNFPVLRAVNRLLTRVKKATHPFSTAAAELYGLLEMLAIGRWVESQGYVVLGKKEVGSRE